MRASTIAPFLLCLIFLTSCGSDPLDVDVSEVKYEQVKIKRFDKSFFALDSNKLSAGLQLLKDEYGPFAESYLRNIVCFNAPDSVGCDLALRDYLTSHITRGAWEQSVTHFNDDFSFLENEINGAYSHFVYYFPDRSLPKGVFISMNGFNYNYIHCEGYYAIGMEYFLGSDNIYYDGLGWPMYKRRTLSKEYITAGFVRAWMMNEFPYTSEKNDVINRIVYEGKILYLQKALLRNTPDSVITGYTQAQLTWCEENEAEMWAKMIEENTVYSENEDDLNHMTMDAPFTPGFPRESPGKAGVWIGLRIVESYMLQHPETSLSKLMEMNDGQTLLTQSKYKPKF